MAKYCIKRFLLAVLTLLIIIAVTFFAMNAVPGGPFDAAKAPSEEVKEILMERYHLDEPVYMQFFRYLGGLLHGDFGVSIKTGQNISDIIFSSFRVSAAIGWRAIAAAIIFGVLLGCLAAKFENRWPDRVIIFVSSLIAAVPNFVVASLLVLIFCLRLQWVSVWSADSVSYVLPVIALMLSPMSSIIRFTKTSMLDALNQNYIRTARSKGLSEWEVIVKHAFRNAAIPVVTYLGPMIAYVLTGSIVIETVFTVGGLGSHFVTAITNRDYSLILGTTVFLAAMIVFLTFLTDIIYKLVDPRIKL